jgi:phosphatidate cytidylyltransferase
VSGGLDASARDRPAALRPRAISLRLASGVILSILTLVAVWRGGWLFAGYASLCLLVALAEFLLMASHAGLRTHLLPGLLAGLAILVFGWFHETRNLGVVLAAVGLWMTLRSLAPPVEGKLHSLAFTVFGVVYVCGLGLHFQWLREEERGLALLVVTLLATWAADTFAFFIGLRWGRRRLAPHVSPGKTVEGFLGGLAGSIAVTAVAGPRLVPELTLPGALLTGCVLGAAAPLGDLLESMVKRNLDAKDASNAIPGHGGLLDRLDSLLVTVPVAFYLFRFLLA